MEGYSPGDMDTVRPGKGGLKPGEAIQTLGWLGKNSRATGFKDGHSLKSGKVKTACGHLPFGVEQGTRVAANSHRCVDETVVVDSGLLHGGSSNGAVRHGDLEGYVGGRVSDVAYHALNLDPSAVVGSCEEMRESDCRCPEWEMRRRDGADQGVIDDRGKVAGCAYARDVDEGARRGRAFGPFGVCWHDRIDAAGLILQERSAALTIDGWVEVRNDCA